MKSAAFNDEKLVSLAWSQYRCGRNPNVPPLQIDAPRPLKNVDRNAVLEYLGQAVESKPVSMADMKRRIFQIIGYKPVESPWGGGQPISRTELVAICAWVESKAGK